MMPGAVAALLVLVDLLFFVRDLMGIATAPCIDYVDD
jgi:hypothetical protein